MILPYEEFLQIQEELEDFEDLKILREERIRASGEPSRSLDDVLREIAE